MPAISRIMIAFGAVLLACALLSWPLEEWTMRQAGIDGVAMIAAGAAAAQGRRSLRRAGLVVGFALPALVAVVFAWRAVELWRESQQESQQGQITMPMPALLGAVALLALVVLIAMIRLRAGHVSAIAERGYSVTTPTHIVTPAANHVEERANRT